MTNFCKSLNRFYCFNFSLVAVFFVVLVVNFMVQFKVEFLQDKIEGGRLEISSYHDQIKMLDVEWSYLTRPARLRELAAKYLDDSGYSVASQVNSEVQVAEFYLANYKKAKSQEFAANF